MILILAQECAADADKWIDMIQGLACMGLIAFGLWLFFRHTH